MEPRLCINCKFFRKIEKQSPFTSANLMDIYFECHSPHNEVNLVTGQKVHGCSCEHERGHKGWCGYEGRYWVGIEHKEERNLQLEIESLRFQNRVLIDKLSKCEKKDS